MWEQEIEKIEKQIEALQKLRDDVIAIKERYINEFSGIEIEKLVPVPQIEQSNSSETEKKEPELERVCVICGTKFIAKNKKRPAVTCSQHCAVTLQHKKSQRRVENVEEKKCEICGKIFTTSAGQVACSRSCKQKLAWKRRKADYAKECTKMEQKMIGKYENCAKCGKKFFVPASSCGQWAYKTSTGKKICSWKCLRS